MEVKQDDRRQTLIQSLNKIAAKKLSKKKQKQFNDFAANAIHFYPDDDYLKRPAEDIFWNIWGLYGFAEPPLEDSGSNSQGSAAKIRVFNPTVELDGWSNHYTTIYVDQRDMPFLVDSLRMALNRWGLNIYTLQSNPVWALRNDLGTIEGIHSDYVENADREALMIIEVDLLSEREIEELQRELTLVLDDVSTVVDSFDPMRMRLELLIAELKTNAPKVEQLDESLAFLQWIYDGYFVFTGCAEFDLEVKDESVYLREKAGSAYGLLKKYRGDLRKESVEELSDGVKGLYEDDQILTVTKSAKRSKVHRNVYSD
ncbi:MAG: hypothetical protein HN621_01405, partial [Porticoccaceae bacterium]|nr:hypothetical protein [Porticoccaceae bacterium]